MNRIKIGSSLAIVALFAAWTIVSCKKDPPVTTPTTNVNLKKGLLLYLPFDGNFADSSGNGNPTAVVGGATLSYDEHGYSSSAYNATGNGEALLVTNNGSIKFDSTYTLSYNFMIRGKSRQSFIAMTNWNDGHSAGLISGTNDPSTAYLTFTTVDSSSGCGNWSQKSTTQASVLAGFEPQTEAWYNVICIYRKGTVNLYVNGTLIGTGTSTGHQALLCTQQQVVVGAWWVQDPISINGKLDEVRLYNRVLNADEIAELSKDFQN